MYQFLHGGRFVPDDVVGDDFPQCLELPFDLLRNAFALDLIGRQAQPYGARIGQVSQFQVGWQGVFPCFDLCGEHRLGQPGRDHRAVYDLA